MPTYGNLNHTCVCETTKTYDIFVHNDKIVEKRRIYEKNLSIYYIIANGAVGGVACYKR